MQDGEGQGRGGWVTLPTFCSAKVPSPVSLEEEEEGRKVMGKYGAKNYKGGSVRDEECRGREGVMER